MTGPCGLVVKMLVANARGRGFKSYRRQKIFFCNINFTKQTILIDWRPSGTNPLPQCGVYYKYVPSHKRVRNNSKLILYLLSVCTVKQALHDGMIIQNHRNLYFQLINLLFLYTVLSSGWSMKTKYSIYFMSKN